MARISHEKWASGFIFQVTTSTQDQLVVNLGDGSSSCRVFQLFGIPCGHALAYIFSRNLNVYDLFNSFYKKDSYEKTYTPIIYQMPHPKRWPNARQNVILPPFKNMPGRPKRVRRRETNCKSKFGIKLHYKSSVFLQPGTLQHQLQILP
ncbi:hypothetical protein UlMin_031793 [Ulmus minor]